jgi:hypothetical protein
MGGPRGYPFSKTGMHGSEEKERQSIFRLFEKERARQRYRRMKKLYRALSHFRAFGGVGGAEIWSWQMGSPHRPEGGERNEVERERSGSDAGGEEVGAFV